MRSIRLSLVIYFLVLLTAAMGTVFFLVYGTTSAALEERRQSARDLITAQHEAHRQEALEVLNKRLLHQARSVAKLVKVSAFHPEGFYSLGTMTSAFSPQPHLNMSLWIAESAYPPLHFKMPHQRIRMGLNAEAAEAIMPVVPAQEYYQVSLIRDREIQLIRRSLSLGDETLPLSPKILNVAELQEPHYEWIETETSKIRVVTVKVPLPFREITHVAAPFMYKAPIMGAKVVPLTPSFPPKEAPPSLFVQYAADVEAATSERVQESALERDGKLARLDADIEGQLIALRRHLFWIAIMMFGATILGGYWLLRLGLTPINRLSDAVSKVTERDFRLQVDPARLPVELQPIAERLSATLVQLGRAFEREKQAAADISHELRTPLAALMATVEVALKKSRSVAEYREILEECQSSGQQMSLLVERLLALARLDAGAERFRPRPIEPGELAAQCADLVRPLAKARGLILTAHIAPLAPVETDPDKLREVVTNLLHNAVEYNRDGGSIELTVDRVGGDLAIEVKDTGIGIAAKAREHIFERFYRADPSRQADTPHAGLGLAIVKSYVDLLGGTITCTSTLGEGTTFAIRLPVKELAAEPMVVA